MFTPDNLAAAGAVAGAPDPGYQLPQDPATLAALEHWRGLKFGVIMHWGLYSTINQAGSWSLCREDAGDFMDPPASWQGTDEEYPAFYRELRRNFTGHDYDPAQWAKACADAGMKYLVFTSKHHDGFAMYDTAESNYKATAPEVPLQRDVLRETFDAFRAEGLETGVYFSKADWAHPGYWDESRPITDRFHNYSIAEEPERWEKFVDFTHRQIDELLTNYGEVNVLWLDAGWVAEPAEPIRMDEIAANARRRQPSILVVDREVHGINENYRTPEQEMPDHTLDYPWESCITMTPSWCSMQVDEPVRPTHQIIATLASIVSRGGNYLLGIGPDATGAMSKHILTGLAEVGAWMDVNGTAIYGMEPGGEALAVTGAAGLDWRYTRNATTLHAIALLGDRTAVAPQELAITTTLPIGAIHILGHDVPLQWSPSSTGAVVHLPGFDARHAFTLAITIDAPAADGAA
ncbi:alpha-L-fucosidase [Specibacter sp. NPDC057265]|uniref:alpha-L-fucosidase n=1 Tax=Specibacter sp. NPDC057265 TaxID=3346075 RepID=UPI00362C4E15